jgi:hypothetical protein
MQASALVIQPPANVTAPVSDENSGDEKGRTINNLPGSLLRAPAYLIQDGYKTYFQIKYISALMNPWFLILVVTGANNIFGESPFDLAISFSVVQHVWATLAGFSRTRVKIQKLNKRNTVSVHQLSFSSVRHLQRHTLAQYNYVFDNVFTSIALLDKLSSMGHQAKGTVRKGRIDRAQLESDAALKKKERGTFNYRTDGNCNIVCRWNDNSAVTAATSGAGIDPLCLVNRYSQKLKNKIQVQQPNMIKVYNHFM